MEKSQWRVLGEYGDAEYLDKARVLIRNQLGGLHNDFPAVDQRSDGWGRSKEEDQSETGEKETWDEKGEEQRKGAHTDTDALRSLDRTSAGCGQVTVKIAPKNKPASSTNWDNTIQK